MGAWPLHSTPLGEESAGPVRMRVAYPLARSAGHPRHLRRNQEESAAGDMWRPVRTLDPGPDSLLSAPLRWVSFGTPEVLDPTQARAPTHRPQRSSASLCSPAPPWEDSASLNLPYLRVLSLLPLSAPIPPGLQGKLLCSLYLLLGRETLHDTRWVRLALASLGPLFWPWRCPRLSPVFGVRPPLQLYFF